MTKRQQAQSRSSDGPSEASSDNSEAESLPRPKGARCGWCGEAFVNALLGRPRRWCKQSCRQRAFEARSHARRLGVDDDKVIVDRVRYDELLDRRHELALAAKDVRSAVAGGALDAQGATEQLEWLLSYAEKLLVIPVEPT